VSWLVYRDGPVFRWSEIGWLLGTKGAGVLVTRDAPCLGPVTVTGCGALCPGLRHACYGCYGPAESPEVATLAQRFADLGLAADAVARRFMFQQSGAEPFQQAAQDWRRGAQAGAAATPANAPGNADSAEQRHD